MTAAVLLVHLVAFAAFLGGGFAQLNFVKLSARPGTPPEVRDSYERLAATIASKIELPALFTSIASGIVFIVQNPVLMKQGWLHGKLTCVFLLLVLCHLEMINAKRIVKARVAGAEAEIEQRKKRHAQYGVVGTLLVVALLVLVTFVRLGAV